MAEGCRIDDEQLDEVVGGSSLGQGEISPQGSRRCGECKKATMKLTVVNGVSKWVCPKCGNSITLSV